MKIYTLCSKRLVDIWNSTNAWEENIAYFSWVEE
jgi:hypothetical protein